MQVQEGLYQHRPRWLSVGFVVATAVAAGIGAVALLLLWQASVPVPVALVPVPPPWLLLLFFAVATLSEIVYVPIRHSGSWEELTFLEAVVVAAVLVLPPVPAITVVLLGSGIAAILLRRDLVKWLFNFGTYAASSAGLMLVYYAVAGESGGIDAYSIRTVMALLLGAVVFTSVNLLLLSLVLLAAEDVPPRELIGEQWVLSLGVAVGSVGIAVVALAVGQNTPALVPFTLMPIVAMWYAYRASASHANARERSRWLVVLGQAVSTPGSAETLVPRAAEALCNAYGAQEYQVRLADGRRFGDEGGWVPPVMGSREAVDLHGADLPAGWAAGIAVRLEDHSGTGVLAIGARESKDWAARLPWSSSWELAETNRAGLVALTSALGSALRAGQTLTALTAETAKLQAVVDHATDGICVVDAHGEVLLWSPAAERITGVGATTPLPDIVQEIVAVPADPDGHSLRFTRGDGQDVWLQVTRVDVWGARATSVLTIRDMTRERRAERLKSDFIATISHELRTPITPIRGYAELLQRRWDRMSEEKRLTMLATIEERAEHLTRLVDDLLMAARADSEATMSVDNQPMDLVSAVADAATAFPEVEGRLLLQPSEPLWVLGDRTRVMQIVGNLVGNAVKYTPAQAPIHVTYAPTDAEVEVRVTDEGAGIAADEQEKVFEKFYRIEDPLTMRTGGSGLGLHISRQLARAMGGDVTLASRPGQGSTFALRLRRAEEDTWPPS